MERPYLDLTELSALFGMKKSSLLNAISSDRFCCPTYKLGRQRVADPDVAQPHVARAFGRGRTRIECRLRQNVRHCPAALAGATWAGAVTGG